jgi:hypothetical protein
MRELEQQAAIKFLWKEGCLAKNIHDRLQAVYGDAAYALPSVYFWIKELKCGREDTVGQLCSGWPPIDNLDAEILCLLRGSPFRAVRSIAEEVVI